MAAIIAGDACQAGVDAEDRCCLHDVHGYFAFGHAFFDVEANYLVGNLVCNQYISTICSAYVAAPTNCNFRHSFNV